MRPRWILPTLRRLARFSGSSSWSTRVQGMPRRASSRATPVPCRPAPSTSTSARREFIPGPREVSVRWILSQSCETGFRTWIARSQLQCDLILDPRLRKRALPGEHVPKIAVRDGIVGIQAQCLADLVPGRFETALLGPRHAERTVGFGEIGLEPDGFQKMRDPFLGPPELGQTE